MVRTPPRPLFGARDTLGHAVIDGDNAAISDVWIRAAVCDPVELPFQIARLRKLLRTHFHHEAALVETIAVELCGPHRQEHQRLIDLCSEAYGLAGDAWRQSRLLLRRDFARLYRSHVICMDQITVVMINSAAQEAEGRIQPPAGGGKP